MATQELREHQQSLLDYITRISKRSRVASVYKDEWHTAEELRDLGIITLSGPYGPRKEWRAATLVQQEDNNEPT